MTTDTIRPGGPKVATSPEKRLPKLEEKYGHELMDVEARSELCERILRLRRRLGL